MKRASKDEPGKEQGVSPLPDEVPNCRRFLKRRN
jgi:hypothetical protein